MTDREPANGEPSENDGGPPADGGELPDGDGGPPDGDGDQPDGDGDHGRPTATTPTAGDSTERDSTTYSPGDHDWRVLESVAEYETPWYTGGYDRLELPDGREKRYYWAELPAAVVVVAVVEDPPSLGLPGDADRRSVVMVEQFRPTIRELCHELPAGIVEDDETFAEAGARELEEEVGVAAGSVELLADFWCATGVLRHRRGIVHAADLSGGERRLDGSEFLDVRTVPVADAMAVATGEAANDATLEGLLLAEREGLL